MAVACTMSSQAAVAARSMVLRHADTHTTVISLESGMTTVLADGQLVLSCPLGTISYPVSGLTYWTYSGDAGSADAWSGVAEAAATGKIRVVWTAEGLYISGLDECSQVRLTDMSGIVLRELTVSDGCVVGNDEIRPGVYVLTVNGKSFKIARN